MVGVIDYYTRALGWPVLLDQDRAVLPVGTIVDALTMPAWFGARVLAALGVAALSAPVIAEDDGWWAFLTGPMTAPGPRLPVELRCWQVATVAVGDRVVLPGGPAQARWISCPDRTTTLPSWSAVVRTARQVAVLSTAA